MAERRNYYYRQLVAEDELDAGFDGLEAADRAMMVDLQLFGICGELGAVSQHAGTPNLTVDITAPVVIYDKLGQRILIPSAQTKDMSQDDSAVSTAVAGAPNEKWVSLFAVFDRVLSDPRVDGNSNTVFFVRQETFRLSVVQGTEAVIGAGVRPSLSGTNILLADVNFRNAETQILNASIDVTRREKLFVITGGPAAVNASSIKGAIGQVKDAVTNIPSTATSVTAAWVFDNITASGTNRYKLASRSITRQVQGSGIGNLAADWLLNSDGTFSQVTTFTAAQAVFFLLDLPDNCVLTNVTVNIQGAAGHAALPATMPQLNVRSISNAGALASLASVNDTSANTTAYQLVHTISSGVLAATIDKSTKRYFVRVTGEGGANFVAGTKIFTIQWTATITSQDDAAG